MARSGLDAQYDRSVSTLTIHLSGDLDAATAPAFSAEAMQRIDPVLDLVRIDLSRLTFCDSSGLRSFIVLVECAKEAGAKCVLCEPTPVVRRLLGVTGLDAMLSEDVPVVD